MFIFLFLRQEDGNEQVERIKGIRNEEASNMASLLLLFACLILNYWGHIGSGIAQLCGDIGSSSEDSVCVILVNDAHSIDFINIHRNDKTGQTL